MQVHIMYLPLVFTHRYDIRVLAAGAATKKTDATSTRRTYTKIQR